MTRTKGAKVVSPSEVGGRERAPASARSLSAVTRRILDHNAGRALDLLELKYARMAASPFAFYRSTCHLFAEAWLPGDETANLRRTPPVWGCADLHFENFGSYKAENGLVYFDVNDFDEAALVPAAWDMVRLAASVLVGAETLGVERTHALALARLYLDTCAAALAEGRASWVERDSATGMTRKLLEVARTRKRRDFLDERTTRKAGHRQLRIDGKTTLRASREDAALVRKLVASAGKSRGDVRLLRVLDVARRIAGAGSLGLSRWVVLVEGEGSPHANWLLDVKEARPSVAVRSSPYRQKRWASDAQRTVCVQRRVLARSPALLHDARHGSRSYVLRELQPSKNRLRLDEWDGNAARLRDAMKTMGEVTGWGMLRASGREGSASADALIAFATERAWRREALVVARSVARITLAQWRAFRADAVAGRL